MSGNTRVLIVDDSSTARRFLKKALPPQLLDDVVEADGAQAVAGPAREGLGRQRHGIGVHGLKAHGRGRSGVVRGRVYKRAFTTTGDRR